MTSCSNYRRLSEQYKLTEAMLERREIGTLTGGWIVYSTPYYNPGQSPIRQALGCSRIKELGFYLIDIVHHFFGMPSAAMAMASVINPRRDERRGGARHGGSPLPRWRGGHDRFQLHLTGDPARTGAVWNRGGVSIGRNGPPTATAR